MNSDDRAQPQAAMSHRHMGLRPDTAGLKSSLHHTCSTSLSLLPPGDTWAPHTNSQSGCRGGRPGRAHTQARQLFPLLILTLNSILSTTPPSGASLCNSQYPLLRLFPLGSSAPRSAPAFPVGGLPDQNSHPACLRPGTSRGPGH